MTQKKHTKDPHAHREAKNYDNPIPSREFILSVLKDQSRPTRFNQLAQLLELETEEQQQALKFRLGAMIRDRQLSQNRRGAYLIFDDSNTITGRLSAHKDGYGFLIPDDKSDDVFLSTKEMRKAFTNDQIRVVITHTSKQGKLEGEIIEVIEHKTSTLVGKVLKDQGTYRLITENPKILISVIIDNAESFKHNKDDIVVVNITEQPAARKAPRGLITQVLGKANAPGIEIEIATRNFDIPFEWPQPVLDQLSKIKDEPTTADKNKRIDARHLPFVTIDGEDARDFDDAVYCEKKKTGGWRLYVAIADVSHYVELNTPLDHEAHLRGTSVYFPKQVIPMLPEKISNGLCSLMPEVDRLCMICEMTISANGRLSGYQFYESVMHSKARLTYNQVGQMLQEKGQKNSTLRKQYQGVVKHLDELENLYKALKIQRENRGAIDFDTVETRIIFNAQRKIESIIPIVRNDAHKLIEECMLCANVASARFMERHGLDALFRVHDGPAEKKLAALRAYLGELGLSLKGASKPQTSDYQQLINDINQRDDAALIQIMVLRSMSQAKYEPDNRGHFGLGYTAYTHFTSPIRRYPDLLTHRAIKSVIRSDTNSKHVKRSETQKNLTKKTIYPYNEQAMLTLGEHCSMTERRADEATRDVVNWLKCDYLTQFTGHQFDGVITAVTGFGFFVELDNLYVEGLVHISQLENDYFNADLKKQRLVGEKTNKIYHLGDKISVIISKVELDERRIHLVPNTAQTSNKKPKKKSTYKNKSAGTKKSNKETSTSVTQNKSNTAKTKKKNVKPKGKKGKISAKSSTRKKR